MAAFSVFHRVIDLSPMCDQVLNMQRPVNTLSFLPFFLYGPPETTLLAPKSNQVLQP
jgi:hypothetical protein